MKKKASPEIQQGSQGTAQHSYHISLPEQRKRLLEALRIGPVTTIEARHELDIIAPAPRIFELRHNDDYNIVTLWETQETPEGHKHRVARYVLFSGKYKGGAAND